MIGLYHEESMLEGDRCLVGLLVVLMIVGCIRERGGSLTMTQTPERLFRSISSGAAMVIVCFYTNLDI